MVAWDQNDEENGATEENLVGEPVGKNATVAGAVLRGRRKDGGAFNAVLKRVGVG